MKNRPSSFLLLLLFPLLIVMFYNCQEDSSQDEPLFFDDFEQGLQQWEINNREKVRIISSGDPTHKQVLELHPGGSNTWALIKKSEGWTGISISGEVLFPEFDHNYLGFIYNYNIQNVRADYGCIYIKGNNSYIRVNPHRDGHVSRILYDEYKTDLTGQDTIITGQWQRFKAEILDSICHFYVGNMQVPKVTFDFHEYGSGKVGFEPRVIGSEVWIDNIRAEKISTLSYQGAMQPPGIQYNPEELLTDWQAIGPFRRPMEAIEKEEFTKNKTYEVHRQEYQWHPFRTDSRGCVVVGEIAEWASMKRYVYFYTEIASSEPKEVFLHFSNTNPLQIWINETMVGEVKAQSRAWYDFWKNPKHEGIRLKTNLKTGKNSLLIRVKGMGWVDYAGDGFFARLENATN